MAVTSVVSNRFFEKLFPVLRELDADGRIGPLSLAMLLPYAVDSGYRSLVLSSPSLDKLGLSEATSLVLSKLRSSLGDDSFKIDSVSILRTKDSVVQSMRESYDISQIGTAYRASGLATMAADLDDPILFVSRPLLTSVAA